MTSPTFEGAVKGTRLREPQQERDFADCEPAFAQMAGSELTSHFGEDLSKARAFILKPPV
jgi:hypothetical protein